MKIDRLERLAIRSTRIVAFLGLIALMALALTILANALSRWLFTAPLDGVRDGVKLIVAIAVSSCIPAVMAGRENITIRFLGYVLKGRAAVALECFGAIIALALIGLLAFGLQDEVGNLWQSGQTTETLGVKIAPWWQTVAILFYLSFAVQLIVVISLFTQLAAGRPLSAHTLGEPGLEDTGLADGATPDGPEHDPTAINGR